MIDIKTVGTGGGSIAWISREGHLKVGPKSAGAVPGPMCYPNGGDQPTILKIYRDGDILKQIEKEQAAAAKPAPGAPAAPPH